MSGSAGTYDPKQEVRFAVVMYGGVSLAIYINGVAQELLRMVRATANLPKGQELSGSERVYRELGQLLGPGRNPGDPPPADLQSSAIQTRFVVDIISGSSAGGINGVALAKALALRLPSLDTLKEVWLEKADLETLLNDERSEPSKYPPRPDGRATSLINSERMYGMVLETLAHMSNQPRGEGGGPFADEIDLFVTATDLAGLSAPMQLTGDRIDERIHKTVFHFEYTAQNTTGPAGPAPEGHFGAAFDPMLAFAARCTSSFPVAFEPMTFERMNHQLERQKTGLDLKGAMQRFQRFFPAYTAGGKDFSKRLFADGGYLDNRPFSYVTGMIQYRASRRPTQRKLLFIDPFPEPPPAAEDDEPREISFLRNATLAATTLPRYEVIRGDIQAVNDMNRQLDRLAALRDRLVRDGKRLEPGPKAEAPPDFETSDLEAMVMRHGYGDKYPPYHHLRVYDVSDELGRLLTLVAGFDLDSDYHYFIRMLVRSWREDKFSAYLDEPGTKETENAFLNRFDVDYRSRRLNYLRSWIDERLSPQVHSGAERAPPVDEAIAQDLRSFREIVEEQLGRLRESIRVAQAPAESPLRTSIAKLKAALAAGYGDVMGQVERKRRYQAADALYRSMSADIDALMDTIDRHFAATFHRNSEQIQAAFIAGNVSAARAEMKYNYDTYHWHDLLTLPILQGTRAREHAEVEIFRVSPADGSLAPGGPGPRAEKLAGTQAAAFAGFAHREWRENDMMWGRLDGAERIVTALLPDPLDRALREHYIHRVQAEILSDEFSAENGGHGRILRCFAQLLRKSEATELPIDQLISRGKEILDLSPSLRDLIDKRDFVNFVRHWYLVPPPPPRTTLFNWSSRVSKILARMIDDLPEANKSGFFGRISGVLRSSGVLIANLVRFATPGSLSRHIARHWLALIALAGVLLAIVGPTLGLPGTTYVGFAVILGSFAGWVVQRLFGRYLGGKSIWKDAALYLFAAVMVGLMVLGVFKAVDLVKELLH